MAQAAWPAAQNGEDYWGTPDGITALYETACRRLIVKDKSLLYTHDAR
jgi:hypothetical protein